MTDFPNDDTDLRPSKSERKREMHGLQALGEELAQMTKSELDQLPVPDALKEAIETARRIKSREALRRQFQFIGKLMRKLETTELEEAIEERRNRQETLTQSFHELEHWRDRLLKEGNEAIDALKSEFPDADRQKLRQLVQKARNEIKLNQPPTSSRTLFRYLRTLKEDSLDQSW